MSHDKKREAGGGRLDQETGTSGPRGSRIKDHGSGFGTNEHIRTWYWDSPKLHSSHSILYRFDNRIHGQNGRFWRNINSWPCFVTKLALIVPNSIYIGLIWSNFHADFDFWGPMAEFLVKRMVYNETMTFHIFFEIVFHKIERHKPSFSMIGKSQTSSSIL